MGNNPDKIGEPAEVDNFVIQTFEQQIQNPYVSDQPIQIPITKPKPRLLSDVHTLKESHRKGVEITVAVNTSDVLPVMYYQGETSQWLLNQFISKAREKGYEFKSRLV